MGQFVKGDVVVLNFPFSDLSQTKRRPALVLASPAGDDAILCQITSQARLFTADEGIILYRAGHISTAKVTEVVNRLIEILQQA